MGVKKMDKEDVADKKAGKYSAKEESAENKVAKAKSTKASKYGTNPKASSAQKPMMNKTSGKIMRGGMMKGKKA